MNPQPSGRALPTSRGPSLAARLTLWYAAASFVLVVISTGTLYWGLVRSLDIEADLFLADQIHVVRMLLAERPDDSAALTEEAEWETSARRFSKAYVRVIGPDGAPIVETNGMAATLPSSVFPTATPLGVDPEIGSDFRLRGDRPFRLLSAAASLGGTTLPTHLIQVGLDRDRAEDVLGQYRIRLGAVAGGALVVSVLVGYWIARRGMRPIEEITAAARRVGSATLNERIGTAALPAEIGELALTFNEMLDRLEDAFGRLSRFSADLAHELRTPVNNLRGEVEVALGRARTPDEYRDALGSCLEETSRLARTIDSLLFLARAESAEGVVQREPVEVADEIERVRAFYEAAASDAGVRIDVERPARLSAPLDRALFQRALGNLVANAIAHTPRGGTVTLRASLDGGRLRVEVADTGRGIAPVHIPHVFERFYRADPSRTQASGGVGLGLAIVRSIAELHGGTASIDSAVGRGTRVELAFPVGAAS